MAYVFVVSPCVACGLTITFNPARVPSLPVNGVREPLCRECFDKWNQIHKTSKGLEPIQPHPDAWGACQESEF